jgi:hypothetical protein
VADVRYLPVLVLLMERDLLQVGIAILGGIPLYVETALVLLMERDLLQVWIILYG